MSSNQNKTKKSKTKLIVKCKQNKITDISFATKKIAQSKK